MDKFDFINRIIALYPHAITDRDAQYDTYNRALNNKIDFEKLMDLFAQEYNDSFPPPAATLREMSQRCLKEETITSQTWLHVKVFNPIYNCVTNTDCFPAGTSEEKILATYKKMFPNTEGWRIVEVS